MNSDLEAAEARKDLQAGRQAYEELETVKFAFRLLKQATIDAIINSPPTEVMFRERCIVAAQQIDAVENHLKKVIENGEVAQELITTLRSM